MLHIQERPQAKLGGGLPYVGAGLPNWATRLVNMQNNGTGTATIALLGDSWIAGPNVGVYMRDMLQALYGDGGAGYVGIGDDRGHADATKVTYARTGVWTDRVHGGGSRGVDLTDARTADANATVTITTSCTDFDIHYIGEVGGGSFQWRVDGGGFTVVNTAAASEIYLTATTGTLADESHTLEIEVISGTVTLCGVNCRRDTGIIVHNLGRSGAKANAFQFPPMATWESGLSAINPDVVMVLVGTNDQNQDTPIATFNTDVQYIIDRIQASSQVIDVVLLPSADNFLTGNLHTILEYRDQMEIVANEREVHFVDTHAAIGNYVDSDLRGLYDNGTHLSFDGERVLVNYILRYMSGRARPSPLYAQTTADNAFTGNNTFAGTSAFNDESTFNALSQFNGGLKRLIPETIISTDVDGDDMETDAGGDGYPDGWIEVDPAAFSNITTIPGFWQLSCASTDTTYIYTKPTTKDPTARPANQWRHFAFNDFLHNYAGWTADVTWYFGVHADLAGAYDPNRFVRFALNWDSANSLIRYRVEYNDGGGQTDEPWITTTFENLYYFRISLRNAANGKFRAYVGQYSIPQFQRLIADVNSGITPATWGNCHYVISAQHGGAGTLTFGYIGSVDTGTTS